MNNTSQWFTDNYKWIEYWAKRWSWGNWDDLLSHLYFYLDKNWDKFNKIPDGEERIKFIQTWFKNNTKWGESEFNKSIRVNNLPNDWSIPDQSEDNLLEVMCESDREEWREWLVDITKTWGEEGSIKLVKLRTIYLELDTHNKVLWDLYFNKMMSMRQIGKKLNLPLSAVYTMIVELKKVVKGKC